MSENDSSSEQPQLPSLPEHVTVEWLTSVLGQKVKAIELTKDPILNASAGKVFVTITYDDENVEATEATKASRPTKVCIKGGFNPVFIERYSDILIGLYKREADFFNRVAPHLKHIDLPRSYWACNNANQGLVIMDDLAALGAEFGEPVHAWPVERVLAGVEQLAGLHAGTWGVTHADYAWADPAFYDTIMFALCARWGDLIHAPHRPPLPDIVKDEARIRAALTKHFKSRNPRFRCLVHGDAHIGNTWIYKGAPRFLDWQTIQVGSAFHDVAYFVSGSLTVEDRRANEMRILDHYLSALARFGGPTLTRDDEEVMNEYRKSMLAGYNWILAPYELQSEARVRTMSERHSTALIDHKTVELIESLPDVE
ncbi:kinase-like domain-containing protein [Hypomontagnella monticulosa]|nr:kinase-like domain-containing protein [Hypomontagnella monticulosa]